jgi:hypothetical protein
VRYIGLRGTFTIRFQRGVDWLDALADLIGDTKVPCRGATRVASLT